MKSIIVLSVFAFISLNLYSQSKDSPSLNLGIEKQFLDSKKEFIFKPDCYLKIKTDIGKKYFSRNYSLTEKSIIMNFQDTILFENVLWIQGEVYNDGDRKVSGVVLTTISLPIIFIGIGETVIAGGVVGYFVTLPFIWMGYKGIRLIGARKFRRSQGCSLRIVENVKK